MDEAYHPAKDRVVAQFEKEYLTRLVSRAGGNMSKAARLASIDRTTLYRLMDKHEFHREESFRIDRVTPETAISSPTSGERRRVAGTGPPPPKLWDPDGPRPAAYRPGLWDALHQAILATQAQWERAIEHASGADEVTIHLAQLSTAVRQQLPDSGRRAGRGAEDAARRGGCSA